MSGRVSDYLEPLLLMTARISSSRRITKSLPLALVVELAGTDGDDLGLLRLLLGGVGDDDATPDLLLGLETLDQNTIVQRTDIHGFYLLGLDCGKSHRRLLALNGGDC